MNAQAGQKEFLPWADLIRVVATILVVTVHVSGQLTNVWGKIPESDWFIANIYGGIARICVPLFFMISGYLLLPRSESLGTFYRKRMPKVVIPFLVWSLIYLGWYCGNHPGTCTPSLVRNLLFVQGTYYHLWFMYSLIGIYLILPVLRLLVRPEADRKILWYLIVLWLVFQSVLNFADHFAGFKIGISAPLANGLVGFFILGYLLGPLRLSHLHSHAHRRCLGPGNSWDHPGYLFFDQGFRKIRKLLLWFHNPQCDCGLGNGFSFIEMDF